MQLLLEGMITFNSRAEIAVSRFISLQTQGFLLMMRARHSPFVTLRVPPVSPAGSVPRGSDCHRQSFTTARSPSATSRRKAGRRAATARNGMQVAACVGSCFRLRKRELAREA